MRTCTIRYLHGVVYLSVIELVYCFIMSFLCSCLLVHLSVVPFAGVGESTTFGNLLQMLYPFDVL